MTDWKTAIRSLVGAEPTDGNAVTILRNGDEIFPAMLAAIRGAEHTVDLVTFVYWTGDIAVEFAECLAARARAGVRVRVVLDQVGARLIPDDLVETMTHAGCDVRWFRPIRTAEIGDVHERTHRKILVVDDQIAFTGGVGIAQEWTGDARNADEWRDTHVRVVGPAVAHVHAGFIDNWSECDDGPFDVTGLRSSDEPVGSSTVAVVRGDSGNPNAMATLFRLLFDGAERRIRIESAYFTPAEDVRTALIRAAERGVDVDVIVPGPHGDKRFMTLAAQAEAIELIDAGVRVRAFQPTMMHAKIVIVDDEVAAVGSANLTGRSAKADDELDLVLFDPDDVAVLVDHFEQDCERSEIQTVEQLESEPLPTRVARAAVSAVSDLL